MASLGAGIRSAVNAIEDARKNQEMIERQAERMELAQQREARLQQAQELRKNRSAADKDLINDVIELGQEVSQLKSEIQMMRTEIENLKMQVSILSTNDMGGFASTAEQPYTAGPLNYFPM